jgi:hypothetical protein
MPGKRAKRMAAWLALGMGGLEGGCGLFPTVHEPPLFAYEILDFTLVGDSAIALRLKTWDRVVPPGPDTGAWPRVSFALLDRRSGSVRPLDTLPASAAPAFPRWFYACEAGRPVSIHPAGTAGPEGTCAGTFAPALSPDGFTAAFSDSQARVRLFTRNLEPIGTLATGALGARPLEIRPEAGRAFVLEYREEGDSVLWRGFATDDPSGSDSAWLVDPVPVRVQGAGTRLVCGEADARADSSACWLPAGIPGFGDLVRAADGRDPEWSPATGELAYLLPPARFVFAKPASGARDTLDADAGLGEYRPRP